MELPSILFWALMAFGLWSRGPAMIYIFFALQPLETFAVIPPAVLGGVTFTPNWVASVFLALKMVYRQPTIANALAPLLDVRRMGLLSACIIYSLFSAYFFPRIFGGSVTVFPMHVVGGFTTDMLKPTSSNFTQSFYFVLSEMAVLAIYLAAKDDRLRPHILKAILIGGGICILTGFADMFLPRVILSPFRTATYALLTDAEVLGAKRIVGLMPEASAYAGICMNFAAAIFFLRPAFDSNVFRVWLAPVTFLMLMGMVVLSTSSTGYLGLVIMFIAMSIYGLFLSSRGKASGAQTLLFIFLGGLIGLSIITIKPALLDKPLQLIDATIFQKANSESYIGRGQWNAVSLRAFVDTFGLGAGLGAARASSWPVALLGNIGLIGTSLMIGFAGLLVTRRQATPGKNTEDILLGAKLALIPIIGMASLSGTSVSFGLMPAALFGLIGAAVWKPDEFYRPVSRLHRRNIAPSVRRV